MDKMVSWIIAAVLTGNLCLKQNIFEFLPTCILKHRHQVACRPEFIIVGINLPNTLERRLHLWGIKIG